MTRYFNSGLSTCINHILLLKVKKVGTYNIWFRRCCRNVEEGWGGRGVGWLGGCWIYHCNTVFLSDVAVGLIILKWTFFFFVKITSMFDALGLWIDKNPTNKCTCIVAKACMHYNYQVHLPWINGTIVPDLSQTNLQYVQCIS